MVGANNRHCSLSLLDSLSVFLFHGGDSCATAVLHWPAVVPQASTSPHTYPIYTQTHAPPTHKTLHREPITVSTHTSENASQPSCPVSDLDTQHYRRLNICLFQISFIYPSRITSSATRDRFVQVPPLVREALVHQ